MTAPFPKCGQRSRATRPRRRIASDVDGMWIGLSVVLLRKEGMTAGCDRRWCGGEERFSRAKESVDVQVGLDHGLHGAALDEAHGDGGEIRGGDSGESFWLRRDDGFRH